jgi:hypothetical protein
MSNQILTHPRMTRQSLFHLMYCHLMYCHLTYFHRMYFRQMLNHRRSSLLSSCHQL